MNWPKVSALQIYHCYILHGIRKRGSHLTYQTASTFDAKPNCHLYFVTPFSFNDFLSSSRNYANVPILLLSVSMWSSLKRSCQNCFDASFLHNICSISPVVTLTVGNKIKKKKSPQKSHDCILSVRDVMQWWELRFRFCSSRAQFFNEDE